MATSETKSIHSPNMVVKHFGRTILLQIIYQLVARHPCKFNFYIFVHFNMLYIYQKKWAAIFPVWSRFCEPTVKLAYNEPSYKEHLNIRD